MIQTTMHEGVENLEKRVVNSSQNVVISSFGTTGAGKSTFLGAVHTSLGYSQAQISVSRGRQTTKGGIYCQRMKGVIRGNATVESVDTLPVFVYSNGEVLKMSLNAPGNHYMAKSDDGAIDTYLFFLDLTLYQHINQGLEEGKPVEFFPLRNSRGDIRIFLDRHATDHNGGTLANALNSFGYCFFKQDELGTLMESLLNAQEKIQQTLGQVPIIGVQTYSTVTREGVGNISENTHNANKTYNSALGIYHAYLQSHGFPNHLRSMNDAHLALLEIFAESEGRTPEVDFQQLSHNERISQFDFGLIKNWHLIDSLAKDKTAVNETLYHATENALRQRGIESEGMRIVRFIHKHSDDSHTVHYSHI